MDHPLIALINARIEAAGKDGAFDNLEGAGKPLPKCDDPENVVMNRILKDNGAVPEVDPVEHADRDHRAPAEGVRRTLATAELGELPELGEAEGRLQRSPSSWRSRRPSGGACSGPRGSRGRSSR